jgi:predicted dehydrogenase
MVIGYGSMGQRHARILKELGLRVAVVSKRTNIQHPLKYDDLYHALDSEKPDYIIIANKTCDHYKTFYELACYGFTGTILVEKPLFDMEKSIPTNSFKRAYVAYNLRFHPIMLKLHEIIKNEKVLFLQVYTGQYLPYWRPDSDYRLCYSSRRSQGGGVLLDLSHELDYVLWLLGGWRSLTAVGGKFSTLSIDSDDIYSILLTSDACSAVQININYLDRINRREITIITENCSIKADLVQQTLLVNEGLTQFKVGRDYTYIMQHRAVINGTEDNLCSLEDGKNVLRMADFAQQAAKYGTWVNNY